MASAAAPITRATADRLVAEVLKRVQAMADWDRHPYSRRVTELLVFGSYLTDTPRLGDVDLAVTWEDRYADREAQSAYERWRAAEARADGRVFGSFLRELAWADVESDRYVRGRSVAVSLHDMQRDAAPIREWKHRVLWRNA